MTLLEQVETASYLMLAALLCGLIGLDRERRDKNAGMRTHMLVGVGACLFTIISSYGFERADTSRVASNVVTGVGFLGAGVIWRSERKVHDLTTAASVWLVAAVGMAVGVGAWFLAITSTLTIWIILAVLHRLPVERKKTAKYLKKSRKAAEEDLGLAGPMEP